MTRNVRDHSQRGKSGAVNAAAEAPVRGHFPSPLREKTHVWMRMNDPVAKVRDDTLAKSRGLCIATGDRNVDVDTIERACGRGRRACVLPTPI
jgi:hypothetical protein